MYVDVPVVCDESELPSSLSLEQMRGESDVNHSQNDTAIRHRLGYLAVCSAATAFFGLATLGVHRLLMATPQATSLPGRSRVHVTSLRNAVSEYGARLDFSPRHHVVAPEVVQSAKECAPLDGMCKCEGFVLIGTHRETALDGLIENQAQWAVFPRRINGSVRCEEEPLGAVSLLPSDDVTCRCFSGALICEQTSEPTQNGCGAGESAEVINEMMSQQQVACCNRHDTCYGLCGSTKLQCDAQFHRCLEETCAPGDSSCSILVESMVQAVTNRVASANWALAQRKREEYKPLVP